VGDTSALPASGQPTWPAWQACSSTPQPVAMEPADMGTALAQNEQHRDAADDA
jgi:hypothetical protein